VKVVAIFVGLCPIHAEQQSVTSSVKLVDKPIQSPTFLSLLGIDLMDFPNCPCDCIEKHTWAMNITDHHTKYVYVTSEGQVCRRSTYWIQTLLLHLRLSEKNPN